jgi:hypothetical protein
MPGEMSVHTAEPSAPAPSRLRAKYPVPAPISSPRSQRPGGRPSALAILPSTCRRAPASKAMAHLAS